MSALIVAESSFGNTLAISHAIARGLGRATIPYTVTIARPREIGTTIPAYVDLLIVGAPTHNLSMPKPATRAQATTKGAVGQTGGGVREWIEHLDARPDLRVVTFDTSIKSGFAPSSASKSAARALKKRGFRDVVRGHSFWVTGLTGPLLDGEDDRADAWGALLAAKTPNNS